MKLSAILLALSITGCAVEPSTTTTDQAVSHAPDEVLARFRMTGAGAAFVGTTQGAPWSSQYLVVDRYVTDAVPPPSNVAFGGGWQDPTSLYLGPYGYYWPAEHRDGRDHA